MEENFGNAASSFAEAENSMREKKEGEAKEFFFAGFKYLMFALDEIYGTLNEIKEKIKDKG